MANYKTPGVYVEEIATLGSSIAGVPTAIAGFTGSTEKAIINGSQWTYPVTTQFPAGQPAPPVRITSLLEYQQIFGGPYSETFKATLTGTSPSPTSVAVATTGSSLSKYILFYQVQMFYANGGGTCYIVSVGNYSSAISDVKLIAGIGTLEQVDEVTLLATPEAVSVSNSPTKLRKAIYDYMAAQCAKLQDRFAILDVVHATGATIFADAADFRDNNISADNLKYVGAYYPALNTPIAYSYKDTDVSIEDNRTGTPLYNTTNNSTLNTIFNGITSYGTFTLPTTVTVADGVTINGITLMATLQFAAGTASVSATNLKNAINANSALSPIVVASIDPAQPTKVLVQSKIMGTAGSYAAAKVGTLITYTPGDALTPTLLGGGKDNSADKDLYNRIKAELAKYVVVLYPSGAMAGTYARVDADRGVWKAPANVGLALVDQPSINITDQDQENLNVDSVSGKSINAIREFTGRGTLVWGARTLAGNNNEWRYINVRRLFIYVEESCKKATEFVVFESNTATTWQRVKGMIEAFLTGLWRDGALAGATTKDAFFVNVGLGTTMTAQDILEGRMIVEIGIAAARPAEFIILRFSHKLQES